MTQPALPRTARHSGSQPAVPAGPQELGHPAFEQVVKGYDPRQVDGWVASMLKHVQEMEERVAQAGSELFHGIESNPAAKRSIGELMQLALDEITGNKAAAAAEIAQMIADAQQDASQTRVTAQMEAQQVTSGAREQAATVLADARSQAKEMLDGASAHASAVTDGAQRRLQQLTDIHEETVKRLAQAHQVTGDLVQSETERGSLRDEVARIAGTPL